MPNYSCICVFTAWRYASARSAVARCLSDCLSVMFVHSIQTAEDIVKLLCQPGSPSF